MRYLDASVLVPLVHAEATSTLIERYFSRAQAWFISDFAIGEVTSAIGRIVRSRLASDSVGHDTLIFFENWVSSRTSIVTVTPSDIRLATRYLRRFELGLRLPDAIHVAMCRRLGTTLVSFDRRLLDAAVALDIAVEVPEA